MHTPTSDAIRRRGKRNGRPPLPDALAEQVMRQAGYEPLEPYPRMRWPWHCRCMECGLEHTVRLDRVRAGQRCDHRTVRRASPPPNADQ